MEVIGPYIINTSHSEHSIYDWEMGIYILNDLHHSMLETFKVISRTIALDVCSQLNVSNAALVCKVYEKMKPVDPNMLTNVMFSLINSLC